jgi:hypothetical protein
VPLRDQFHFGALVSAPVAMVSCRPA